MPDAAPEMSMVGILYWSGCEVVCKWQDSWLARLEWTSALAVRP